MEAEDGKADAATAAGIGEGSGAAAAVAAARVGEGAGATAATAAAATAGTEKQPPRERALFLPLRDGVCDVVIGAWGVHACVGEDGID